MKTPDLGSRGFESAKLLSLARRIPEPADYFSGRGAVEGVLPGKILCFVRQRASTLNAKPAEGQPTQHHRCVLIAALRGEGSLRLDADTFSLKEAQAQLISPFQYHSYAGIHPERICWVFITFEVASLRLVEPLHSCPSSPMGPVELFLLQEILQCWTGGADGTLLALHLALLLRRLGSTAKAQPLRSGPAPDLVARVNGYALPRLGEPFRLKELGAALGESESHLRAKFRQLTGESLGRHLRQLRLRRACQMLVTTALSVTEVARQSGFDSVYSFSRCFSAHCGVSPRAYRENKK